jgi:ribosome maturation factor RimP
MMAKSSDVVIGQVIEIIEPILAEMGFELVDIEYLSEYGRRVLRIYVDTENGITLDDCALVSREIGNLLDIRDIVQHEYVLEVSSPGLNRPLRKEEDFLRAVGKRVKARTVVPVKGRRNFTGCLRDYRDGVLYIEVQDGLVSLSRQDVEKANLVYELVV